MPQVKHVSLPSRPEPVEGYRYVNQESSAQDGYVKLWDLDPHSGGILLLPPSAINTVPRYLRKGFKMDPPEGVDPNDLGWVPNGKLKPRTDDATMLHVAEAAGQAILKKEKIEKGRAAIAEVFGDEQAGISEPDSSEDPEPDEAPEAPKPKERPKRKR